jgi:hypothetical protein
LREGSEQRQKAKSEKLSSAAKAGWLTRVNRG